jgi:hypothetical protein
VSDEWDKHNPIAEELSDKSPIFPHQEGVGLSALKPPSIEGNSRKVGEKVVCRDDCLDPLVLHESGTNLFVKG